MDAGLDYRADARSEGDRKVDFEDGPRVWRSLPLFVVLQRVLVSTRCGRLGNAIRNRKFPPVWGALYRAIGAIDTAVTLPGFEYFEAALALIEPLAGVSRHNFQLLWPQVGHVISD